MVHSNNLVWNSYVFWSQRESIMPGQLNPLPQTFFAGWLLDSLSNKKSTLPAAKLPGVKGPLTF